MLKLKKSGQSTAEYAIVIALVIAAALAMQTYVKRGIQGKIRDQVDNNLGGAQYEPYYLTQNVTSTRMSEGSTNTMEGGEIVRATNNEYSTKSGSITTSGVK